MTKRISLQMMLLTLWTATFVPLLMAQETGTGQVSNSPADAEEGESQRYKLPEAEFVGSTSFRSGSIVQSLWSGLNLEAHYFGGDENNVGYTGGSWTFHGEHWKIAPGFGVAFGDNGFHTMPALSVRWSYAQSWFIAEGLLVQGLQHTRFFPEGTESEPEQPAFKSVVPSIADGNHISARWKRLTVGGTWEHEQFREGKEWKGGVRMAFRVLPPLSFTFFAMGPGNEIRGGVLFQPEEKK